MFYIKFYVIFYTNDLMIPCPKRLKLESGQGKEITLWNIDIVAK